MYGHSRIAETVPKQAQRRPDETRPGLATTIVHTVLGP